MKSQVERNFSNVEQKYSKGHHQGLARMWSDSNSLTLLVGAFIDTAILESSVAEFAEAKVKHVPAPRTGNSTPRHMPNRCETSSHQKTWTRMFIVLFVIAPNWKQPKGPSIVSNNLDR